MPMQVRKSIHSKYEMRFSKDFDKFRKYAERSACVYLHVMDRWNTKLIKVRFSSMLAINSAESGIYAHDSNVLNQNAKKTTQCFYFCQFSHAFLLVVFVHFSLPK